MGPWGVVDIENPNHCDFTKLRTMLMTFMQDLKEVTQDFHYQNYRAQKLESTEGSPMSERRSEHGSRRSSAANVIRDSRTSTVMDDKDEMLRQKELELQKMQEMIAKMQAQMQLNNNTTNI